METKLNVTGMHCKSCGALLTDVLSEVKGIENVHVDFKTGIAIFSHADKSAVELAKAEIKKLGYGVI